MGVICGHMGVILNSYVVNMGSYGDQNGVMWRLNGGSCWDIWVISYDSYGGHMEDISGSYRSHERVI